MYQSTNEYTSVTRDLLMALGLEINKTNAVVDQETKTPIPFEGKTIKANTDPNKALYISEYDVKLDPLNPMCTNLLEKLFGKFLDDMKEAGNLDDKGEVSTFFFDKNEETDKYILTIKFTESEREVSKEYYNKIYCYLDLIFRLDGTFSGKDFTDIDNSIKEESDQDKKKK